MKIIEDCEVLDLQDNSLKKFKSFRRFSKYNIPDEKKIIKIGSISDLYLGLPIPIDGPAKDIQINISKILKYGFVLNKYIIPKI